MKIIRKKFMKWPYRKNFYGKYMKRMCVYEVGKRKVLNSLNVQFGI